MISDKSNWGDFIVYQINKKDNSIKIQIRPTSPDYFGYYSLKITLTDNGGDTKDGPPENVNADGVKTSIYKVSLIVGESNILDEPEDENKN